MRKRSRCRSSHGENRGSSPLGSANDFNHLEKRSPIASSDYLFFVYYPFLIFPILEIRERFRAGEHGGEAPRTRRVLVPARYAVAVSASLLCYKTPPALWTTRAARVTNVLRPETERRSLLLIGQREHVMRRARHEAPRERDHAAAVFVGGLVGPSTMSQVRLAISPACSPALGESSRRAAVGESCGGSSNPWSRTRRSVQCQPLLQDAVAFDPEADRCLCHPVGASQVQAT
jgi:hypothetical protein